MSDKAIRATGSATVSFGLVSVACKIYSAIQDGGKDPVKFNLLHKGCGSRLNQQYVCQKDGQVVSRDNMDKGFEYTKDTYVSFSTAELKALEEKSTYTIDIEEFIPLEKIDTLYMDKPYFLGPDKGAARAYSLLGEAMRRSGRAAVAHYASRGKSYCVMLRAVPQGIIMQQLRYQDEVRSFKDVPLDPVEPKDAEVALALQLVGTLAKADFDPSKYKDDVKGRIQKAIQDKIDGKEITVQDEPAKAQIVDIMAALQASLGLVQKQA
jgi:DNA end-binding protein Ku